VEHPAVSLTRLNEEHGYLDIARAAPFRIGDRLSVVPNHVCSCINMHDEVFIVRGNEVIDSWKIQARGKVR
jgi:D-serine deaminase-like pyridoxal phosphate-dependent protein